MNTRSILQAMIRSAAVAAMLLVQCHAQAQSSVVDQETTIAPAAKPDMAPATVKLADGAAKSSTPDQPAGTPQTIGGTDPVGQAGQVLFVPPAKGASPHRVDPEEASTGNQVP